MLHFYRTKDQYLHDKGWTTSSLSHHEQAWVKSSMQSFHLKQNKWLQKRCTIYSSYHFSSVTVRTFKGKIFYLPPRIHLHLKNDDIGNVEYPEDPSSDISISINKIDNAYIAEIKNLRLL